MDKEEVIEWLETPIGAKLLASIADDLEFIQYARARGDLDLPGEPDADYQRGIARGREEQLERMKDADMLADYIMWEPDDE